MPLCIWCQTASSSLPSSTLDASVPPRWCQFLIRAVNTHNSCSYPWPIGIYAGIYGMRVPFCENLFLFLCVAPRPQPAAGTRLRGTSNTTPTRHLHAPQTRRKRERFRVVRTCNGVLKCCGQRRRRLRHHAWNGAPQCWHCTVTMEALTATGSGRRPSRWPPTRHKH